MIACPARCDTCRGRGQVLAPLEQALADFQAEAEAFPPGTALLLTLTFLSFALEGIFPVYRYRFWLYGRQALAGQWWQVVTSLFLHTDLLQLGFNMAALWGFGPPLEAALGSGRFVFLYVTSGAVGNLLSLMMNPYIQTVGASGCLFGVAGAWIGLQLRARLFSTRVVWVLVAYVAVALALGFGVGGGMNNQAHLGGFLWGLVLSLFGTRLAADGDEAEVAAPPDTAQQPQKP